MTIYCSYGCGRPAIKTFKSGKHCCSNHHRSCPALEKARQEKCQILYGGSSPACSSSVRAKMEQANLEKYGVPNASQAEEVKQAKQQTFLDHYGSVEKKQELSSRLSAAKKASWERKTAGKRYNNEGLTRAQYRNRCQQYADTQYNRHKQQVDPQSLRSRQWHLDHIYSVQDGWLNDVPVNIISDITNLRIVHYSENFAKCATSHKSLDQLIEDYQAGPNHHHNDS